MTSKQSPRKTEASTPATVHLSPHWIRRHREQLDDWLHANGIDPDVVSPDHAIRVEGNTITYWAYGSGTTGGPEVDPETGQAVTVEQTARCTRPVANLTDGGHTA